MNAVVPAPGPLDGFAPFGTVHLLAVCACAALLAALTLLGRRLHGTPGEWRVRRGLAIVALAYWVVYNTWWNWGGLDLTTGLPLQACDVSGLVAPFALLTLGRWLRATLYFWAVAFATQAFIQPTLSQGPVHLVFWFFWAAHTIIIGCAIYDLVVLGFRPGWGDFVRASVAAVGWGALALAIDLRLGANYGYIGNPPAGVRIPPLVEAFGPWPERLVVIAALAALAFLLALAPWLAVQRLARGSRPCVADEPSTA
jgi:hypothetical integral membrane protein (TIGR02206 family)